MQPCCWAHVHIHPYMFIHRLSWGGSYDGLASTEAGIQAVVETDSSHLQVQASNILHICASTAVKEHKCDDVFKIKCSTRIAFIREWKCKPPLLNYSSCQLVNTRILCIFFISWRCSARGYQRQTFRPIKPGCLLMYEQNSTSSLSLVKGWWWSRAQSHPRGALWLWYYLLLSPTSSKTMDQIWLIAVDY